MIVQELKRRRAGQGCTFGHQKGTLVAKKQRRISIFRTSSSSTKDSAYVELLAGVEQLLVPHCDAADNVIVATE
jgi:hypothetical protein